MGTKKWPPPKRRRGELTEMSGGVTRTWRLASTTAKDKVKGRYSPFYCPRCGEFALNDLQHSGVHVLHKPCGKVLMTEVKKDQKLTRGR